MCWFREAVRFVNAFCGAISVGRVRRDRVSRLLFTWSGRTRVTASGNVDRGLIEISYAIVGINLFRIGVVMKGHDKVKVRKNVSIASANGLKWWVILLKR